MKIDPASRYEVKTKKRNDGKIAEGIVRSALIKLRDHWSGAFVRLYDTTSTGAKAILPETPCDFIFARNGITVLLEVKSSDKHQSLTECQLTAYISGSQFLASEVWGKRAGVPGYFLFYSLKAKQFELWDSQTVTAAAGGKTRLCLSKVEAVFPRQALLSYLLKITETE